jgi:hypothetical protein
MILVQTDHPCLRVGRHNQAQVEYSVVERSGGWVTSCVIHIVHVEVMRSVGFPI